MTAPHAPDIRIAASVRHVAEQSDPAHARYVFAYRIRINNASSQIVQLISRHWIITRDDGSVEEVRGDGVVGEQPVLTPGETFEYVSGCMLPTPVGTMHGSYQMVAADGQRFDAPIAPFTLAAPGVLN